MSQNRTPLQWGTQAAENAARFGRWESGIKSGIKSCDGVVVEDDADALSLWEVDIERVGWAFTFAAAAYNLARLPKLLDASS
jgi:hypothetical protein